MLDMVFDAWTWTIRSINRFETMHWTICFCILLFVGFVCMRGLGSAGRK